MVVVLVVEVDVVVVELVEVVVANVVVVIEPPPVVVDVVDPVVSVVVALVSAFIEETAISGKGLMEELEVFEAAVTVITKFPVVGVTEEV